MFLEKPSFPISLELGQAQEKVSILLEKKHWNNFSFSTSTLIFVPYWFFSYDIFEEDKKTKLVSSGSNALNAFSREFEKKVSDLEMIESVSKTNSVDENIEFRVLESKLSEQEAREIIPIKIASQENISRANLILSGLETFFVPIWIINIDLQERVISLRVNATTGEIINADSVPNREKGFSELAKETINELATPNGWFEYSVGVISSFSNGVSGKAKSSELDLQNPDVQILVLAIIALIVIIWVAYL